MPDIGFLELLLVGVIAFLVLGPERMPELFGQVGRMVKKGRGWFNDVRKQIDAETALNNPLADIKDAMADSDITDWNKDIMKNLGQTLATDSADKTDGTSNTDDTNKTDDTTQSTKKEQGDK